MSYYSLDLNSIKEVRCNDAILEVPPTIQKDLASFVSKNIPLKLDSPNLGLLIHADGVQIGETRINTTTAKRLASRILEFGSIAKNSPALVGLEQSRSVHDAMYQGSAKGLRGRVSCAVDVISNATTSVQKGRTAKQIMDGSPIQTSNFVKGFGCANGILWLFLGANDLYAGSYDFTVSREMGDREGELRARARIWSARAVWIGAAFDTINRVAELTSKVVFDIIWKGFDCVASGFFCISSLIGVAMASLSILRCWRFRERLQVDYLGDGTDEKVKHAFKWLQTQIGITQIDKQAIHAEVGNNNSEVDKKIDQLARKKVTAFKRRTSLKSIRAILDASQKSNLSVDEMKKVIQLVLRENSKKMILNVVTILAALTSLAALVISSFFGIPAVAMILYAISTGIYAVIGSIGLFSSLVWRDSDAPVNGFPALDYVPASL